MWDSTSGPPYLVCCHLHTRFAMSSLDISCLDVIGQQKNPSNNQKVALGGAQFANSCVQRDVLRSRSYPNTACISHTQRNSYGTTIRSVPKISCYRNTLRPVQRAACFITVKEKEKSSILQLQVAAAKQCQCHDDRK